jgi:magnesium transporter
MPQPNFDDSIALHMRTDLFPLRNGQTVGEALAHVRARPPQGRILYLYVADDENRLLGVVPTRRILLDPLETKIEDIMIRKVITIASSATVLDACELFMFHKLLALPVVDDQKHFLGVVDIELYTDELLDLSSRASHEDAFQLLGFRFTEARRGTPWHAFLVRFPWLSCNIAGGILAALLAGFFQGVLNRHLVLALFIPAVLSLSESVGIQSVSLALDALHGSHQTGRVVRAARRELFTSALLGVACGMVLGLVALVWQRQVPVALTLLISIGVSITCAGLIGLALPYVLRWLKQDPRVAAGPIALVAADLATLLIYYNVADRLLP